MDLQTLSFLISFMAAFCAELPADWKSRINPAIREEVETKFNNRSTLTTDDIIWDTEDASLLNTQADHTGRMFRHNYWLEMRQCIPFKIHSSFDRESRRLIKTALDTISTRTSLCVAFKEQTTEQEYISISPTAAAHVCEAGVGRIPGTITKINLGSACIKEGIIIHEVLHALGFYHEQNRPDRDAYVQIYDSNIDSPEMQRNFARLADMPDHGVEYDLNSILHYNHLAFAKDTESPTILPRVRSKLVRMGQRERLSALDVIKVQRAYECIDDDYRPLPPKKPNRCEDNRGPENPTMSPLRKTTTPRHRAASSVDVAFNAESMEPEQEDAIRMSVCASYRANTPSGLVILQVTAIAGYNFDCEQLRKLARNLILADIEQINCDPASFELHIREIHSGVSVCFNFDCDRDWTYVDTPGPGRITVYRYEDSTDQKTVNYSLGLADNDSDIESP